MKVGFAIIGNKFGEKIYSILKESNYAVRKIPIRSPKKYNNRKEYFKELSHQLNLVKNKDCNIVWLAITPKKNDQFEITKKCLNNGFNVILEKPWKVNKHDTQILQKIQNKKKVLVGFNFEYLYLNFFKKKLLLKKNIEKLILNFHAKNNKLKKNHKSELGSHLNAIKNRYFPSVKNYEIKTGYKKNLRKINIKLSDSSLEFNFTKNKEKIIQKFVIDYCKHLKNIKKFEYDFNFAILAK